MCCDPSALGRAGGTGGSRRSLGGAMFSRAARRQCTSAARTARCASPWRCAARRRADSASRGRPRSARPPASACRRSVDDARPVARTTARSGRSRATRAGWRLALGSRVRSLRLNGAEHRPVNLAVEGDEGDGWRVGVWLQLDDVPESGCGRDQTAADTRVDLDALHEHAVPASARGRGEPRRRGARQRRRCHAVAVAQQHSGDPRRARPHRGDPS